MKITKILILFSLFISTKLYSGERITLLSGDWPPFIGKKLKGQGVGTQIVKSF